MRKPWSVFLLAAACAVPPAVDATPGETCASLIDDLRAAAGQPVPTPPELYVIDPASGEHCAGAVVLVDGTMLAIRIEHPDLLPAPATNLLLPVFADVAIKGDAVVVRRQGDLLLCRFFPRPADNTALPEVGDEAVVDWATSRKMAAPQR